MTLTPPRIKWVCRPVGEDNEYVCGRFLGVGGKKCRLNFFQELLSAKNTLGLELVPDLPVIDTGHHELHVSFPCLALFTGKLG